MDATQPFLISTFLLLLLLLPLLFSPEPLTSAAKFSCEGPTRSCNSMLGYKPPNATTYFSIQTLFTLPSLSPLLGANNLSSSTPSSKAIPKGSIVRILFPCSCSNGTGTSRRIPVYTVQPGDGLDHIARDVFGLFVEYQEIADANGIKNVDVIDSGQQLVIPLPCSCDKVDGEEVMHYAYKVEKGDTFETISEKFGVKANTVMNLNGFVDGKQLMEESILDIPLKVDDDGSTSRATPGQGNQDSAANRITVTLFALGSVAFSTFGLL